MTLFRKQRNDAVGQSSGIVRELEGLLRSLRLMPLVGLVLIAGGFGFGNLTARWLELPEDRPVRQPTVVEVPLTELQLLGRNLHSLRSNGAETVEYVTTYREHIEPVERTLLRRGMPAATARQVAWPLVEHAYRRNLDPATVIAVMFIESGGRPGVTSPVGARGLMQVMPAWAGHWRGCGRDLYDIEANLCNGTSILAWYLGRNNGDEHRALLGYNGCVRGTNTPNCHTYPDKVARLRMQIQRELGTARAAIAPSLGGSRRAASSPVLRYGPEPVPAP
jgi:hypothetical protein